MYNYGNGKYRFLSKDPIQVNDDVVIGSNDEGDIIAKVTEILEQRPDKGRWAEPHITTTLIAIILTATTQQASLEK